MIKYLADSLMKIKFPNNNKIVGRPLYITTIFQFPSTNVYMTYANINKIKNLPPAKNN